MVLRLSFVLIAVLFAFGAVAQAGEYYYTDDDIYWEYWDGEPAYKVLIPSKATSYLETDWGGQTTLHVTVGANGPHIVVGTLPLTDPDEAWKALSAKWSAIADRSRTTTNSEIVTDMGLSAAFRVLTAEMNSGPDALVRMVSFRKGNRLAYLLFIGNASQYGGDARQYWLKAVHSFIWR